VGLFEGGEFFNTLPTHARIWGTRRWIPGVSYEEIEAEFERLAKQVEQETGATVQIELDKVGEAAQVSEDERLVRLVKAAAEDVTGRTWPITGNLASGDPWIFINVGHVPCTCHAAGGGRAHSNPEYVALRDIVRASKVYALTALRYAGYQG
jgi:acetylornithine deacetylase/succinyl-diaminopimelate desuccinylase-like protein